MGIEVVEGRNFSREFPRDSSSSVLVNQALVKALELEDPIGEKVIFLNGQEVTIIGVLDDFHYASLHHEIGPFAFVMPFTPIDNVLIKISGNNIPNQIQQKAK